MDILAGVIFIAIPLVATLIGLVAAAGVVLGWNSTEAPEAHYIASRVRSVPVSDADRPWLKELEALRLPYRHTIC